MKKTKITFTSTTPKGIHDSSIVEVVISRGDATDTICMFRAGDKCGGMITTDGPTTFPPGLWVSDGVKGYVEFFNMLVVNRPYWEPFTENVEIRGEAWHKVGLVVSMDSYEYDHFQSLSYIIKHDEKKGIFKIKEPILQKLRKFLVMR